MIEPKHADVTSEHQLRMQKVEKLASMGISAWPELKPVNATCKQILDAFKDDQQSPEYMVSGRILTMREHGKTMFATIQDRSGRLQVYLKKDDLGDQLFQFVVDYIDLGDIVWVKGPAFRTKMGEVTIKVDDISLQSKSLYPLPEKFHGLADVETKYRQRYLDLISDVDSRKRFLLRSAIIRAMRNFFASHDFVEVETPMLHPIPGGAAAKPFKTHHNALDMELYLRIAPELYLKRLVVGGFERVFEINRNFRNEGISTRHNPEFTMVEWYMAYNDYHAMMNMIEELIKSVIHETGQPYQLPFGNHIVDFAKPFERISMKDAVCKYAQVDAHKLEQNIDAVLVEKGIKPEAKDSSWGQKLLLLFEGCVEHQLIQPTFIIDFPIEISPLSKRDPRNPQVAARFELFICAMEIANGFNELNDPFDQAERFKEQAQARSAGDVEAHYYDADFILALEHGLPPTVGAGIGVDRLTMLLTNTTSIKDVILFPTLKRKE
jgi:lysyl-tRNA synthetase class 2